MELIDAVRTKYDPLAALVRPHITLVFPFESNLHTGDIAEWLHTALQGIGPFALLLQGVSRHSDAFGHYLFLNVRKGKERIKTLHSLLYAGILRQYKLNKPYDPHMTIGKLPSEDSLNAAYRDARQLDTAFSTTVDTIFVETIGPHGESIIETEYSLK